MGTVRFSQAELSRACASGSKDTVELLLSVLGSPDEQKQAVLTPNRYSENALHCACKAGNKDTVELLLLVLGSPDEQKQAILAPGGSSMTALHYACASGDKYKVELLLSALGSTDVQKQAILTTDGSSMNALHWACASSDKDTVELLLSVLGSTDVQKRAVLTPDGSSTNALHWACKAGNKDTVEFLLSVLGSAGDQKQAILTPDGYSVNALHYACASGNKDTVELLLSLWGCPDEQRQAILTPDGFSRNALHWACTVYGGLNVVQLLLCFFDDDDPEGLENLITHKDRSGRNCLFGFDGSSTALVFKSLQEVLEPSELEKHIIAVDEEGNSPIHQACKWGNQETLRCLLDGLSDPHKALQVKNKGGECALDLLKRRNLENKVIQMVHQYTDEYYVDPDRPGQAFLYYTTGYRPKWKEELDLVYSLCDRLNIKVIDAVRDVMEAELKTRFHEFLRNADPGSSVWLFIMSHGCRGSIIICGGKTELSLQELVNDLAADPKLTDTPKVIVSNACRDNKEKLEGFGETTNDKPDVPLDLRGHNLYVVQSTGHGATSERCVYFGCLDDSIMNSSKGQKVEVMDIFREASRRTILATKRKQRPEIRTNSDKRLFLEIKQGSHTESESLIRLPLVSDT